ncbi:MAG: tetraacyldisaccharide 4'-kinase [Sulfurospirillaceae bacterium]|nr:tetraacyldisaccharide 4'-kinase [Sulfurospirillaceae bacterium]MDD2825905.1 tetraacyldisaccharide 4'-kinase [Sulfurospirillaceae bacterium]
MFNKSKLVLWVETYLFHPTSFFQRFISYLLLPLSAFYCFVVLYKRFINPKKPFISKIPIISIGNLTVGGNGKTPLCITLAKEYTSVAIILRGYGRGSKGLVLVSQEGQIQCDARASGDEAMLFAKSLPHATVIVSEDRIEAIQYAKKLGTQLIFLDDGFSKSFIQKFDILVKPNPEPNNHFCLPSGPYREPRFLYSKADLIVEEGIDFDRYVTVQNPTEKMLLVTAISKPSRLDKYLPPNVIGKVTFRDHYMYHEDELLNLLHENGATSILTTQKDAVKMINFYIPLSILELEVKVSQNIKDKINTFLAQKR